MFVIREIRESRKRGLEPEITIGPPPHIHKKKNPIDATEARNDAAQADGEARKMYKWYSRRMRLGGVPHRALHLLPLARPQKERARERNVQLAQILCARLPAPVHVHAPRAHLTPRDVQRARDDAP